MRAKIQPRQRHSSLPERAVDKSPGQAQRSPGKGRVL